MSTFDIKKFLINERMTRVSRDRKRLLKENQETLNEYFTATVGGHYFDNRKPEELLDYVEERFGYRPEEGAVDDFFEGNEMEPVYTYIEDLGMEMGSEEADEEMFDLYFNPERGNARGWYQILRNTPSNRGYWLRSLDEGIVDYIDMEFDVDGNGPDFKTFKNPDFAREMWNRASKKAKEAGYKKLKINKHGEYRGVK